MASHFRLHKNLTKNISKSKK